MTKEQRQGRASDSFLREAQVLELVPISAATLWRMVKDGDFPKPRRISARAVGWLRSEVAQWIDSRAEA